MKMFYFTLLAIIRVYSVTGITETFVFIIIIFLNYYNVVKTQHIANYVHCVH